MARNALNVYMDDIILFTKDLEAHESDMLAVMAWLKEKNIKTSFSKSKLVTRQIEFLGNIIEGGEIRTHPKRATCLRNMKRPQTLAELQRLMGMTNYSRAYIPRYAEIAKPLYDLMDIKNVPENLRKKQRKTL